MGERLYLQEPRPGPFPIQCIGQATVINVLCALQSEIRIPHGLEKTIKTKTASRRTNVSSANAPVPTSLFTFGRIDREVSIDEGAKSRYMADRQGRVTSIIECTCAWDYTCIDDQLCTRH